MNYFPALILPNIMIMEDLVYTTVVKDCYHQIISEFNKPIAHLATRVNSKLEVPPRLLTTRTTAFVSAPNDSKTAFTRDGTNSFAGESWMERDKFLRECVLACNKS